MLWWLVFLSFPGFHDMSPTLSGFGSDPCLILSILSFISNLSIAFLTDTSDASMAAHNALYVFISPSDKIVSTCSFTCFLGICFRNAHTSLPRSFLLSESHLIAHLDDLCDKQLRCEVVQRIFRVILSIKRHRFNGILGRNIVDPDVSLRRRDGLVPE